MARLIDHLNTANNKIYLDLQYGEKSINIINEIIDAKINYNNYSLEQIVYNVDFIINHEH